MASFTDLLQNVTDDATREALAKLHAELQESSKKSTNQVRALYDFCDDLDERLRNQERYTSKDCIIIQNPPFNAENNTDLAKNILEFFKTVLKNDKIEEKSLKAFHILPNRKPLPNGILPAVIVKFVYFQDKDDIFRNRRKLRDYKNPYNNKNTYIIERLPPVEQDIKQEAEKRGFIVSTWNCTISVLCRRDGSDENIFVQVRNKQDLQKIRNPVIRAVGETNARIKRKETSLAKTDLTPEKKKSKWSQKNSFKTRINQTEFKQTSGFDSFCLLML